MSIHAINWAVEVCERINVPPSERLILMIIAKHHHEKTGECFPSYDKIAKQSGFQRRKVIYAVAEIEANGLIFTQKRRQNGHQGSNHFVLFGKPNGKSWRKSRVHKKAPCKSAPQCTLPRVHPSAPDRDWSFEEAEPRPELRAIAGGRP